MKNSIRFFTLIVLSQLIVSGFLLFTLRSYIGIGDIFITTVYAGITALLFIVSFMMSNYSNDIEEYFKEKDNIEKLRSELNKEIHKIALSATNYDRKLKEIDIRHQLHRIVSEKELTEEELALRIKKICNPNYKRFSVMGYTTPDGPEWFYEVYLRVPRVHNITI